MTSRSKANFQHSQSALPPVLRDLAVVAAAVITRDGLLEDANTGFMRLLPEVVASERALDVRGHFVNPRFDQIAARGGGEDGIVYRGTFNVGEVQSSVRSLQGAIYAQNDKLLLIAEPDMEQLERQIATLETLNHQLSEALRESPRPAARISEQKNPTRAHEPSTGAVDHIRSGSQEHGPLKPQAAPAGKGSGDNSRSLISVDVAIALLRMSRRRQ